MKHSPLLDETNTSHADVPPSSRGRRGEPNDVAVVPILGALGQTHVLPFLSKSWISSIEVFTKLFRHEKRVTNVENEAKAEVMTSNQAFAPEPAVHIVGQSSSSRPTAKAKVLQAISVGDLPHLQSLFSSLGIQSGQPEIEYPYDHE